ncbi:protein singed wings 2 [Macrosteles quadrilineatus]|uniref:protein singed wings 2 n=1 Tax=Macrosteles quadrilineatus TaxID=74068 RepID=UPI0023E1C286|nr:protein singed wings 2 [Macrosteles quadrilineatus]
MDYWIFLLFLTTGWLTCECFPQVCQEVKHTTCELKGNVHLVCVGVSPTLHYTDISFSQNVTNVTLCAWPYGTFKVNKHIGHLIALKHLLLCHSAVQRVESFSNLQQLESVNLTSLRLRELNGEVFSGLSHLASVDLRNNQLSSLNFSVFARLPALQQIFLIGNNWTCDPGLLWIIANESHSVGSKVRDRDELYCEGKSKTWPKPLVPVMKFIKVMQSQCPPPCNCSVDHVVRAYTYLVTERGMLLPHIKVNCNRRNFTSMPTHLPDYTTALYLRGNHLTSVEELVFNPHYQNVREIYLDNNQIKSVNILEGSDWINNFGVLNLRGNQLKQIPLYALDHAFQSHHKLSHIYLGNNPWKCDCKFTIHFRDFIKKYNAIIKDVEDIRCESISGNLNSNKLIILLNRKDLCHREDSVKLSFVDKLNIFLACMILLVMSVFLYNLTIYKTTGRLPWMVAKLF